MDSVLAWISDVYLCDQRETPEAQANTVSLKKKQPLRRADGNIETLSKTLPEGKRDANFHAKCEANYSTADRNGAYLQDGGTFVDHWIIWTPITALLFALWWFLTAIVASIFTNYLYTLRTGTMDCSSKFKHEPSATESMSRRIGICQLGMQQTHQAQGVKRIAT